MPLLKSSKSIHAFQSQLLFVQRIRRLRGTGGSGKRMFWVNRRQKLNPNELRTAQFPVVISSFNLLTHSHVLRLVEWNTQPVSCTPSGVLQRERGKHPNSNNKDSKVTKLQLKMSWLNLPAFTLHLGLKYITVIIQRQKRGKIYLCMYSVQFCIQQGKVL